MTFLSPLQTDAEFQWDPDSVQKAVNCGPSAVEKIANFYKNLRTYGIERTRKLGTTRVGTGTNTTEQKRMLDRRGIPSSAVRLKPAQVKDLLRTSRRPMVLWFVMEHIPANIRRHSFLGWHAVTGLANGQVNGITGIWIMDPNFKRGEANAVHKIFVPDAYWVKAHQATGGWSIVPDKDKVISTRNPYKKRFSGTGRPYTNIRSGPSTATLDVGNLYFAQEFTSNYVETNGGRYIDSSGRERRDWVGYFRRHDQRQVWVARGYLKEV